MISRDGTTLYSPVPDFIGKSVLEADKDNPSLVALVKAMLQGREGIAEYTLQRIGAQHVSPTRKYAVYRPGASRQYVLVNLRGFEPSKMFCQDLTSFRNKLAALISLIFVIGVVMSTLASKGLADRQGGREKRASGTGNRATAQPTGPSFPRQHARRVVGLHRSRIEPAAHRHPEQCSGGRILSAHSAPDLKEVRDILKDIVADDQRAADIIRRLSRC